ncbi:MAG TPA: GntR family transcriptional regulator [Gemmatimonadales bacterium]|nr:GntR family transcriptional regulator [Gemmatimonadales bacterium]
MRRSIPGEAAIRLPGARPMADELYDHLREAIVRGELAPNERVIEEAVAARARVSRTPVREALHRLEVDGLVRTSPRGTTVVEFSAEELAETCAVRDHLEGLAARLAAAQRTDLDLVMLDELTAEYEAAIADVGRIIDLNHEFHDIVWEAARNRFLTRQLSLVRALIERRDATTLSTEDRQREALVEHRAIVAALRACDADAAEAAALEHFHRASARRVLAKRASQRRRTAR